MTSIKVLYAFARSGGTLVNRLLGVHPDCWVISEVNPAATVFPLSKQAHEWLSVIDESELRAFDALSYGEQIRRLSQLAEARSKTIVVRDWATANFLAGVGGDWLMPTLELEQEIYLSSAGFEITPLVLTRRGEDVFESMVRAFPALSELEVNDFGAAYLAYAKAVANFPRVALETLRETPSETLRNIMNNLGFGDEHVEQQISDFSEFVSCTGDVDVPGSRSAMLTKIAPATERPVSGLRLNQSHDIVAANRLLGYEV